MLIEIKEDVFDLQNKNDFIQILNTITRKPRGSEFSKFNLFVDIKSVSNTELYNDLNEIDKEILDFYSKSILYDQPKYFISNENLASNFLNIEEAIRFLEKPLWIILENNKNDSYFIKSLIHHFDKKELKEHVENGWIDFENAGGCSNVQNFIEGKLTSFDLLALNNNKNSWNYYRAIVILDSDKEFSTQLEKTAYSNLKTFLTNIDIECHILEKRSMENYMPDEVFEDIRENVQDENLINWINVYFYLSSEQKDFLNFNDGFNKDFGVLDTEIQSLYRNQLPSNFQILKDGFKYPKYKNQFPEFYIKNTRVNKYTLEKRCNSNELNNIINLIEKQI